MSRCLRTRPRKTPGELNLVCFPHAGGSATFFRGWFDLLPSAIQLHTVQYPGRAERISEPLLPSVTAMAEQAAAEIVPLCGRPTVLFGHSMGAAVAYEVAVRLERAGMLCDLLIVSGQPAPHRRKPKALHLASDEELLADIGRIGASGSRQLGEDAELRDLLLPMIRADYQAIETYRSPVGGQVQAPVVAFRGESDEDVSAEDAAAWSERTLRYRGERVFPGGHFYLQERPAEVVGALVDEALLSDRRGRAGQPVR